MKISYGIVLGVLLATGGVASAAEVATEHSSAIKLDISSQPLGDALNEFAKQARLQVVLYSRISEGLMAPQVVGNLSAQSALSRLLDKTGLRYEYIDTDTVGIFAQQDKSSAAMKTQETRGPAQVIDGLKLAQAENLKTASAPAGAEAVQGATDAAQRSDDNSKVEEVVVTAQRREEKLQNVPISISVLDGKTLDRSNLSVVSELERVPGMAASDVVYGGTKQLSVRGVTSTQGDFGGTSTVGYYLDTVPFGFVRQAYVPDSSAYDLERVEVLRGPQGTLYGVSATNGVVRVLTHEADLNRFEFKARSSASTTQDGGSGYRIDSAVNVPLISDKLAARAVVGYEKTPGWIDSPFGKDVNDGTNLNLRLKLKAAPTEHLSLSTMVWHSETKSDGRNLSREDRTTLNLTPNEKSDLQYDIYAFNLQYEFSAFTLSSSTSYIDLTLDTGSSFTLGGAPILLSEFDSKLFSQEINLNSAGSGPWRWSLGGIFRDASDRAHQNQPGGFPNPQGLEYNDYSKSFAVFGELTRELIAGKLDLTGGLRYFSDSNEVKQIQNITQAPPPAAVIPLIERGFDFHKLSPRVVLTWHPSNEVNVYTSYAEGFRSGFSQSPSVIGSAPSLPPVDPDNLKNYEVGMKGGFLDGLLSVETAVFYMDWQGVQQSIAVPLVGTTAEIRALINGKSASGMGAELALRIRPSQDLEIGGAYSWNALEFDEDVTTLSGGIPRLLAPKGSRLVNSPETTVNVFGDYFFPVGSLEGSFSASASYTSSRLARSLISNVATVVESDSSVIGRVSFGIGAPDARWSGTFFVDNVTDFRGFQRPFANPNPPAFADEHFRMRPRTFGIQYEFRM